MDIKTAFALVSVGASFATFVPYFIGMSKREVVPHIFSWTTWGILDGLGFILSMWAGGGGGAWVFASESFMCFLIAIYSYFRGEKQITLLDKLSFWSAIALIILYALTKDALTSVCLASVIYTLGFVPTFRKSYTRPYSEPALTYFLTAFGFAFSLAAIQTHTFVSVLLPLIVFFDSAALTGFLLWRRKVYK